MTFDISFQQITVGPLEIRFYSLLILSGLLAGVVLAQREAKRLQEDPTHVVNIAVVGSMMALVGARLYHVFDQDQWPYYRQNPGEIIAIWNGGIGIFGAIAGAALGLVLYVWWINSQARNKRRGPKPIGYLRWLDIGAPAFLLGQGIGRWGNLFNQELFGPPTDLPWGIPINVAFRPAEYIDATRFHPLFFYESLLSLAGVAVLLLVARRLAHRLRTGDLLLLYFIWYPAERFVLEFLRIGNWKFGAVPTAQIVGVVLITAAVGLLVLNHRRSREVRQEDETQAAAENQGTSRGAQRRQRRRIEPGNRG